MTEECENLIYPDDLVEIWRYSHRSDKTTITEDVFQQKWCTFHRLLSKYAKRLPRLDADKEADDAASDYLINQLLCGPCPEFFLTKGFLINEMTRYLSRTRNPVQYELNSILHTALLDLEKQGKIIRMSAKDSKTIRDNTFFILEGNTNALKCSWEDYQKRQNEVPNFCSKIRAENPEKTRMLSPSDAKELVLSLLNVFGGWTKVSDLFKAMQYHIPPQLIPFSFSQISTDEDDSLSDIEAVKDPSMENFCYESDFAQMGMISSETADRIWQKICAVNDKLFCLYFLPKVVYEQKVRLTDFGATSTVNDKNKKIEKIMKEELENYSFHTSVSERERICINTTVKKILQKLQGKCTEKRYIPHLSVSEGI